MQLKRNFFNVANWYGKLESLQTLKFNKNKLNALVNAEYFHVKSVSNVLACDKRSIEILAKNHVYF